MTHIIENNSIKKIHHKSPHKQIRTKSRPDQKRNRQNERRQQIEHRLIHLLKNKQLSPQLPKSQPPIEQYIGHIIINPVHKEKIPPKKPLLPNRHLAEPATCATRGTKDSTGCFGLDEDGGAHDYAGAKLASDVAKEPVLADREAWMLLEGLDEEFAVPDRDCAMREGGAADDAGEDALEAGELVFDVLSLTRLLSSCNGPSGLG